jgi:hypothetical protein
MKRSGHGIRVLSLGSAMLNPSTPCGRPSPTPFDTPRRTPLLLHDSVTWFNRFARNRRPLQLVLALRLWSDWVHYPKINAGPYFMGYPEGQVMYCYSRPYRACYTIPLYALWAANPWPTGDGHLQGEFNILFFGPPLDTPWNTAVVVVIVLAMVTVVSR